MNGFTNAWALVRSVDSQESLFIVIFVSNPMALMPKYIALLRGINVSGQKIIKMEALRGYFEGAGCTEVQTYIQSGNVAFAHPETDAARLRAHIEAHLAQALGYAVPTLLRDRAQLQAVVDHNPFPPDLPNFGKKVYVAFFESPPSAASIAAIAPFTSAAERFELRVGEGFLYYEEGLGQSKLSHAVLERKLGTATMRNWNTVTTLLQMSQ